MYFRVELEQKVKLVGDGAKMRKKGERFMGIKKSWEKFKILEKFEIL